MSPARLSTLDYLRESGTIISTDTGEYSTIAEFQPRDHTTNPSLVYAALQQDSYKHLVDGAVALAELSQLDVEGRIELALEHLLVSFGLEILSIIPGRVSLSIDPRLAYSSDDIVRKAHRLLDLAPSPDLRRRIMIKIPATWEGIQAAGQLEAEGVQTNMTLVFGLVQAKACAEAGATAVSPFLGRILDWHKETTGKTYSIHDHPGVRTVKEIQSFYAANGFKTQVMAAGFRNVDEICAVAGVDILTAPPSLLSALRDQQPPVHLQAFALQPIPANLKLEKFNRETYPQELADEAIAVIKVREGLDKFGVDAIKLEKLIGERIRGVASR